MDTRGWYAASVVRALVVVSLLCLGCSRAPEGRVIVSVTVDWEGAQLDPDGLDAIDYLRKRTGPITHFVSAAYFTKAEPEPIVATIVEMVRPGDELAVHLHGWRSLAQASGVAPRTSPSFATGDDTLEDFDGDAGYETDPDVYDASELRAILQTSRRLLAQAKLPVSRSFRGPGFLGTPKLLLAAASEGFTIDSSAFDHRVLEGAHRTRVQGVWPKVDATTQPFAVGTLLELPITAFADFTSPEAVIAHVDAAYARLAADPARDLYLVFGMNLETAGQLAGRLGNGLEAARKAHPNLAFMTVEQAGTLARVGLGLPP